MNTKKMVMVIFTDIKSELKNKRFFGIAIAMIIGLTVSCKKQETVNNKNRGLKPDIECNLEIPDTLYTNQEYSGTLRYKSPLDTITTKFGDRKEKYRSVLLFLTTATNPHDDYKKLKQAIRDTFAAENNREIPIYGIKFDKAGIFYIEGIINDFVLMDIDKKNKEGLELARQIENESWFTHKVVVIDKPK